MRAGVRGNFGCYPEQIAEYKRDKATADYIPDDFAHEIALVFNGRVEKRRASVRRRRVSAPRSSNRTCRFPASGLPMEFIVGSRNGAQLHAAQPQHAQLLEHNRTREAGGSSRGHLVTPGLASPSDRAFSEASGSLPAFAGSSPITRPLLLQKRLQSKGPSLHRRYPASSVT